MTAFTDAMDSIFGAKNIKGVQVINSLVEGDKNDWWAVTLKGAFSFDKIQDLNRKGFFMHEIRPFNMGSIQLVVMGIKEWG